jgi:hypothetical protein
MKKLPYFRLIEFVRRWDYGHELYVSFFKTSKFVVLQIAIDYSEYPGWPYLQITSGMGKLFGILINVWRIGISLDIFGHPWRFVIDDMEKYPSLAELCGNSDETSPE